MYLAIVSYRLGNLVKQYAAIARYQTILLYKVCSSTR